MTRGPGKPAGATLRRGLAGAVGGLALLLLVAGTSGAERVDLAGAKLPVRTSLTAAAWDGNQALVFGGLHYQNGWVTLDQVVRYNPTTDKATYAAAKLSPARYGASAVWDGTNAFVFGGRASSGPLREVLRYSPLADALTPMGAQLPGPRSNTSAVWDGTHAYVFGGHDGSSPVADILRYTPGNDTLVKLGATLPFPRHGTSAVWNGSAACVFGGHDGVAPLDEIVCFTPATGQVRVMGSRLPSLRMGTSAAWDGQHAYVFGGSVGADQIVRYAPGSDSLQVLSSRLPSERRDTSAVWNGTRSYVFGGFYPLTGNTYLDQLDDIVRLSTCWPPALTLAGSQRNDWYATPVEASVAFPDPGCRPNLSVDGGAVQNVPRVTVSADGSHVVRAWGTTAAGAEAEKERSFRIDRTPPTIAVLPQTKAWQNGSFVIEVRDQDGGSGLETCSVRVMSGAILTVDNATRPCNQPYQVVAQPVRPPISTAPCRHEGPNACRVRFAALDLAGNRQELEVSFSIDFTPPASAWVAPAEQAWQGPRIRAHGADTDALSGVARCEAQVLSNGLVSMAWAPRPCNAPFDVAAGVGQACRHQGENTCKLQVRAWDAAGNLGPSANRTVHVDWTPPVISASWYLEPFDDQGWSLADNPLAGFNASDNLDPNITKKIEAAYGAEGFSPYGGGSLLLRMGLHEFHYRATDHAGNVAEQTQTLRNGDAPGLRIRTPAAGGVHVDERTIDGGTACRQIPMGTPCNNVSIVTQTVQLAAEVTPQGHAAVSHVRFLLDDALLAELGAPPYTWPWNTATTSSGEHVIRMRATDGFGHFREEARRVFVVSQELPREAARARLDVTALMAFLRVPMTSVPSALFGLPLPAAGVQPSPVEDTHPCVGVDGEVAVGQFAVQPRQAACVPSSRLRVVLYAGSLDGLRVTLGWDITDYEVRPFILPELLPSNHPDAACHGFVMTLEVEGQTVATHDRRIC